MTLRDDRRSHWGSLHDAWQEAAAADAGGRRAAKEPLPAAVVIAIAEHRLHAVRVLRDALDREPGLRRRIGALRPHARDAQGRNWNIPAPDRAAPARAGYETELGRVVDAMRDQFDLA